MREIKFRGLTKKEGWVYGDLVHKKGIKYPIINFYTHNGFQCCYEVDPKSVGQYTVLHDDSGEETEIFESDIVEFYFNGKTYVGVVKFEAGAFILTCNNLPDGYITLLDIMQNDRDYYWIDGVVKGNIHDNPELLEEESKC